MTDASFFSDPLELDRYLAEELSADEREQAEYWLAQYPDDAAVVAALRAGMSEARGAVPSYDYDARVAAIVDYSMRYTRRVRQHSSVPRVIVAARGSQLWKRKVVVFATGIGLVLVAGVVGQQVLRGDHSVHDATIEHRVYQTANAQRASITLSDGSTVHLGPATRLTTIPGFGEQERRVQVSGEAYFTVAGSAQQPFIVEAGNSVVRVLGTAFNVRKYDTDSATQVTVAEGRVLLRAQRLDGSGEAILPPSSFGMMLPSGQIVMTPHVTLDNYLAWRTGMLKFRDVALSRVVADLGRAYDVEIRIADSALAAQLVTLSVSTQDESVLKILDGLMFPLDAHYRRQGRVITIAPGPANSSQKTPSSTTPITSEIRYGK